MACLVEHDLDSRLDLTPWLATVLVGPDFRRRGIGSALCERAVAEARALAVPRLYLATHDRSLFYARMGWRRFDEARLLGLPATIMTIEP